MTPAIAATFALAVALLLAGVRVKRADERACDFANETHQEDAA